MAINFLKSIARTVLPKETEYKLGLTKRPMTFEVGEGLTPEQKVKAEEVVRKPAYKKPDEILNPIERLIQAKPLFREPEIAEKGKPLLPELAPKRFIGEPDKKTDLIVNTILGLPEATVKTLPFIRLLREPLPKTTSGKLKAVGNEAVDFIRGLAQLAARPIISGVSLLKDEPLEQQIKTIPFLGEVPTYERDAYEQLIAGVSPLEVGISLAAEAAITTGIISPSALRVTRLVKPRVVAKTTKTILSREDISNITRGSDISLEKVNAFKKAINEGIKIGEALRRGEQVRVKVETPNTIGELLYRPVSKGVFEKIIQEVKKKEFAPGLTIKPIETRVAKISKELKPLAQEVRKFKTVEKFIKANENGISLEIKNLKPFTDGSFEKAGVSVEGRKAVEKYKQLKDIEPIKISPFGIVEQGHHRILAAIESGQTTIKGIIDVPKSQLTEIYTQATKGVEKRPPTAERIIGKLKASKITRAEDVLLREKLRVEARGAKFGLSAGKKVGKEITAKRIATLKKQIVAAKTEQERVNLRIKLRAEVRGAKLSGKVARKETRIIERAKAKEKIGKILTAKQIIQRRRASIRAVKEHFGLSDADLRSITKKDIRLMNNYEFKQFLDDIRNKAEKLTERRQAMNELLQQIKDKELNVENLRKAMKLPTMPNMTIKDIKTLDEAIKPFQVGDEFLSVRKLETVDRTELKGIKTWREARERLAKKLGVPLEDLQNIKVSEFDRFRYDTALAEKNPFYKMIVEEPAKRMLISEAEYLKIEKKIFALARKIKDRAIIEKLIPQYKKLRKFMESTPEEKAKITLTKEETDLVKYMTKEFENARDYLIKMEAMKMGKDNYMTHVRRGILEAVKEDGIISAAKEAFTKYKEQEQAFNILDRETGEILAMDKFFKFAMHRTGVIKPTENVVKAFLTYMRTFKKKQALDEIVPLVDIYAHALTPKGLTDKGLLLHGNLIRFVKEWLNTQKGRHITLIAKQGGKIDGALRVIKMFTSLRDLGINIPVSIATEVGEQITTYQLLGKKKFAIGKWRQNTKKGKAIIEKYRNFIGKNPWKELVEPAKEIGDRLMEGIFILFRDAGVRANKTFLLGSLSKEEFRSGVIDSARLAALRTELGRYRMVEGMKSIIGATPEGKSYTQYKKWAIPILRTTIKNFANISKKITRQKVGSKEWKKSILELYRLVEVTAFAMLMFSMIRDKDDNSFVGKIINKAYREATTLIQALSPKMFLTAGRTVSFIEDLGNSLYLILTAEEYKTKEGYKGVEALKRQLTPVAVSQFKKEEKKTSIIKGLDLDLKLDLDLDLDLDLGL